MFVSQLLKIGKIIEPKNKYQTIIDSQKKYYRKYFINVILDPAKDFERVGTNQLEEYVEEKIYDYGFGITTGSGALYSPSFNIKWDDIKDQKLFNMNIENHQKALNFEKLFLMVKKTKHEIKDDYVNQFITFLEDTERANDLRKEIVTELFEEFTDTPMKDRPMKVLFSFKIKQNETEQVYFPGQLEGFRQWYVSSADVSSSVATEKKGLCQACNEIKAIAGPFNTGLFTLDQNSFAIGFSGKNSNQFQICKDCFAFCSRGFNYVEEQLNFYAYKYKKGRDDVRVYHYLIPIAQNPEILQQAIKQIKRVKFQLNQNKKILLENQIKIKSDGLRLADKERKKVLNEEITRLKKDMKRYEEDSNRGFDINELIEQLDSTNLSFLDIYYIVTDNKQNPTVKEIIDAIIIEKERIQFLKETIGKVKEEYDLDILKFNDLGFLVESKQFINILARFLNGGIIDVTRFQKYAFKTIKQAFKDDYFKKDKSSYFSSKIRTFQVMYSLFQESGNFQRGG